MQRYTGGLPGPANTKIVSVHGKSRRRLLAGLALTGLGVSACGGASASAPKSGTAAPAATTSIVVATPDQVTSVVEDAGTIGTTDGNEVALSLQAELIEPKYVGGGPNGLLTQDPNSFQGVLAQSYQVSTNGLTVTFNLRPSVISDHGNPLTAQDVLWSFQRKFASPASGASTQFAPMLTDPAQQIHVINASTVSFTVSETGYMFPLLSVLAENLGAIYDEAYLAPHATSSDPYAVKWSAASISRANFGFGPYELTSYTSGQGEVLTANDHYALGAPKIKTIERRVVASAGTRELLLKNGSVQVAEGLSPSEMSSLHGNANIFVPSVPTNNLLFIVLNTTSGPFANVKVRQAFAYAVPYQQIITNVYGGLAQRRTTFMDPSAPNYKQTFTAPTYDPQKAKSMLAAAGYPNGVTVPMPVTPAMPDAAAAATQIQSFAGAAGFTMQVTNEAEGPLFQSVFAHNVPSTVVSGRVYTLAPPLELRNFTTLLNFSGWTDSQFQTLVANGEKAGSSLSTAAGKDFNEANALLAAQAPYIVVAATEGNIAVSSAFHGFTVRSDGRLDYSVASMGG